MIKLTLTQLYKSRSYGNYLSPKKYIECSYNTINSEWSDWVTTSYDAAGAILALQNWVTAQVS